MNLLEAIKRPFLIRKPKIQSTSNIEDINIDIKIDPDEIISIGFKDEGPNSFFYNSEYKKWASLIKQKIKIDEYRRIAKMPEIEDGISDIINEASFTEQREKIIKLDVEEENEKIKTKLNEEFDILYKNIIGVDDNIYYLLERFYIDGQINIHLNYNKNNIKEGIKSMEVISPFYLYFDIDLDKWIYMDVREDNATMSRRVYKTDIEYDREEIIRADSNMYEITVNDKIILGWLESVLKSANQLQTLEDLLIPMRFSRSVSRRVFNVDVGDLPPIKAEKYLQQVKKEFKYKKFYDTSTGKISNQQHIASMVEDYWFANRNGARGTTVETIDETGNLGELADLLYFQKKIFRGMKIPTNRSLRDGDSPMYDGDTTQILQEEMKFFLFVKKFRQRFLILIKEIFKRNILSKGVLTKEEYKIYENKLYFYFSSENRFFIKLKQIELMNQHDIFAAIKENIGANGIYSYKYVFDKVFNMTTEEMEERFKDIKKEESSKILGHLYKQEGDDF